MVMRFMFRGRMSTWIMESILLKAIWSLQIKSKFSSKSIEAKKNECILIQSSSMKLKNRLRILTFH